MLKPIIKVLPILLAIFITCGSFTNSNTGNNKKLMELISGDDPWVDSVFNSLNIEERIAQLFFIGTYPNLGLKNTIKIEKLIQDCKIGGLVLFQAGPVQHAQQINRFQALSKTPLLISTDAEWGLGMRLDSTVSFPRQLALGAIQNDSLIFLMGQEIARQCKRLGIHINFAPVVDLNNNPQNPVINSRAFGENRDLVSSKSIAYMNGLQSENVLAVAKHFPGHGDTDTDSHFALPVVHHSRQQLDSLEFYPFKKIIDAGIGGVMIAHLSLPAIDSTHNLAASLSHKIVTETLIDSLNFKGLVFTDALGMRAVSDYYSPGEADYQAFLAGADVLLMSKDIPLAIKKIAQAVADKIIPEAEINKRCKKILALKKWVGLNNYSPVDLKNLYIDLNNPQSISIQEKLAEASITVIKNNNSIPLVRTDTLKMAAIAIGNSTPDYFQKYLQRYDNIKLYNININAENSLFQTMLKELKTYDKIIVSLHSNNKIPSSQYGISQQAIKFIDDLAKQNNIILNFLVNPYSLQYFENLAYTEAIILSYENTEFSQKYSAQAIYGGCQANGKLPVTVTKFYPAGTGFETKKTRLKYASPLSAGLDYIKLQKIDSLIEISIKENIFPGCQILAAKDGIVFLHKAFGHQTYDGIPVTIDHIYDIASITKIAGTLPAIMGFYEQGIIDINMPLSNYLNGLDTTNKKKILIKEILSHHTGMQLWLPFYLETMENKSLKTDFYRKEYLPEFPYKVADSMYVRKDIKDTVYKIIYQSPLRKKQKYRYSDLGIFLLFKLIEQYSTQPFDENIEKNFFAPLGAYNICYNPLRKFPLEEIVPTEYDNYYRNQLVHGYVHDPAAALVGGVAGHAGLFGNANDLAKLMQMYLQKGEYGGVRFFKQTTIEIFNQRYYSSAGNRRALGFDKKPLSENEASSCSKKASEKSFGHTGFTGTIVWADPENKLIFVFLSNRTYPTQENKKLITNGIRKRIHDILYEAIL